MVVWLCLNHKFHSSQRSDRGFVEGMKVIFSIVDAVEGSHLLHCIFEEDIDSWSIIHQNLANHSVRNLYLDGKNVVAKGVNIF